MKNEELLYTLALTRIPGLGLIGARRLLLAIGDQLTDLFKHPHEVLQSLPESTHKLEAALKCPETLRLCEAELAFAERIKSAVSAFMTKNTLPACATVMTHRWCCSTKEMQISTGCMS